MPVNLNKGKEDRDNFERLVASMLVMELLTAESHYDTQLDFARKEGWKKETIDDLEWKLEAVKSELSIRGLRY